MWEESNRTKSRLSGGEVFFWARTWELVDGLVVEEFLRIERGLKATSAYEVGGLWKPEREADRRREAVESGRAGTESGGVAGSSTGAIYGAGGRGYPLI